MLRIEGREATELSATELSADQRIEDRRQELEWKAQVISLAPEVENVCFSLPV